MTSPQARLLIRSGLLDVEFYGLLRGRVFDGAGEAAQDAVTHGMPAMLSPSPFLDLASLPASQRRAWAQGRLRRVLAFWSSPEGEGCRGPLVDPARARRPELTGVKGAGVALAAGQAESALGAVAQMIGAGRAGGLLSPDGPFGGALEGDAGTVDWARVPMGVAGRVANRVSVIVPSHDEPRATRRALDAVLRHTPEFDLEVVLVDLGSAPYVALSLAAHALARGGHVRYVRLPDDVGLARGLNVGAAVSSGRLLFLQHCDTTVRRGCLAGLVPLLDDPAVAGAQALLLAPDDTVQSAGTVFLDGALPGPLLAGHPPEDARGVAGHRFSAASAAALLLRAEDLVAVRGYDPSCDDVVADVDLCLRLGSRRTGGFRVAPEAWVSHDASAHADRLDPADARVTEDRWADLRPPGDDEIYPRVGLRLSGPSAADLVSAPTAQVTALPRPASRLRWSLRLSSTAGYWGDDWGDTHFASALARALRSCGQEVVTRRRGAWESDCAVGDDVSVAIRGRYRIPAAPGACSVLWVISHPDDVTVEEVQSHDLVFAASASWAALMTRRSGRLVRTLLQATEIEPSPTPRPPGSGAVFVGSTDNGRSRPVVHHAVDAGLDVSVYGRGWEGLLPQGAWRGEYLAPEMLPDIYAQAEVVLADHWPDMARNGFVANRVFDALAAGTPVLSDRVAGIETLLDQGVVVVRDAAEVKAAVVRVRAGVISTRSSVGGEDRDRNSFHRRAKGLAAAVMEHKM